MSDVLARAGEFQTKVYPASKALYQKLVKDGQHPKVMIVGCADSRIVPELMLQAEPGEIFVTRNAGNIAPPFTAPTNGVAASVEYAVTVVGVTDLVVCGHHGCGAMAGLGAGTGALDSMPDVRDWVRYGAAALAVVDAREPKPEGDDRVRQIALENVKVQLGHLRTYPSVAKGLAAGTLTLHGWYADIDGGAILTLDEETGEFSPA